MHTLPVLFTLGCFVMWVVACDLRCVCLLGVLIARFGVSFDVVCRFGLVDA